MTEQRENDSPGSLDGPVEELETDGVLRFACTEEEYGRVPEPRPANKALPDWYRQLNDFNEVEDHEERDRVKTVRRCMPFFDAMSMGWIIPVPEDLRVRVDEDRNVWFGWESDDDLAGLFHPNQIARALPTGDDEIVMNFTGSWVAIAPEGYSLLVTSPLNRFDSRFESFSGVIDIDQYYTPLGTICRWTGGEYEGTIEKGTPMVQVIPFKRDAMISDAVVDTLSEDEQQQMDRQKEELADMDETDNQYRDLYWQSKPGSRNI